MLQVVCPGPANLASAAPFCHALETQPACVRSATLAGENRWPRLVKLRWKPAARAPGAFLWDCRQWQAAAWGLQPELGTARQMGLAGADAPCPGGK